ncbi:hypothetical protein I7I53_10843 [Histoplasma capsulatum var. duboisii H88]|uniref:Uncharacterized protein n=1 Tax=Ajellomyces capsulatus (strain H88) TaxID=544711 RepID=A0A8A1LEK2_AJEC8|nr:hypothetical protein I7I53_10843 [Histoplasma capsulatum var. duboisii H88]
MWIHAALTLDKYRMGVDIEIYLYMSIYIYANSTGYFHRQQQHQGRLRSRNSMANSYISIYHVCTYKRKRRAKGRKGERGPFPKGKEQGMWIEIAIPSHFIPPIPPIPPHRPHPMTGPP